jgi:DNA-binding ferritin-like protein
MLNKTLIAFIGCTKALSMWVHSAHHVSKGPSFGADHELLYGRIYDGVLENFDKLVEKSIVVTQSEHCACPIKISKVASAILGSYQTPVEKNPSEVAELALGIIGDHIINLDELFKKLESEDKLTLGMNDFLSSLANQYEEYYYLLGQRCKGE